MTANKLNRLYISDFTKTPGPRYRSQGKYSGEEFYNDHLQKAFEDTGNQGFMLEIILDGTIGYNSSFLDEAFGRLVYHFGLEKVRKYLTIKSQEEPEWIDMLEKETYIQWNKRKDKQKEPQNTYTE